jgi:hypothetical protein
MGSRMSQSKQTEKKPYTRPELQKHGKVESLTQGTPVGSPSCPIKQLD